MLMMSIFDPTGGSYSLGGVLLRRNTLYVREAKSTDFEEEEERTFVRSAVSVPLKPLFRP